jgi:hypothetical protein
MIVGFYEVARPARADDLNDMFRRGAFDIADTKKPAEAGFFV